MRSITDMTELDTAGIRPSTTAKRLQREAYRAWMIGLIFSSVSGIYILWQLRQREQRINKRDGEGVVESKKIERYGFGESQVHEMLMTVGNAVRRTCN